MLFIVAQASFDHHFQREHVRVYFTEKRPSRRELFVDVSFLQSGDPEQLDGIVFRADRKHLEIVQEENVDFESHWPGEDDVYWSWDDLKEILNEEPESESDSSVEDHDIIS